MQITIGNHEDSSSEDLNAYINAFSLTKTIWTGLLF